MLANRVRETTTTTGTGNITLAGAETNFQSFNTAFGTDRRFNYFIVDDTNSAWETGIGYLSASTTLVRDEVLNSTNSDAAVNFSAGAKYVFCSASSEALFSSVGLKSGSAMHSAHYAKVGDTTQTAMDANELWYYPFLLLTSDNFNAFKFNVALGSGNMRLGLYDVKNGEASNLIAVHNTTFGTLLGLNVATFDGGSVRLQAGWYIMAIVLNGSIDIPGVGSEVIANLFGASSTSSSNNTRATKTKTYAVLPDVADITSVTYETGNAASIALRQG